MRVLACNIEGYFYTYLSFNVFVVKCFGAKLVAVVMVVNL
jgi:hypothetical protein